MSLLNDLIKESASSGASGAGGVANDRGNSLFAGGSQDKKSVTRMMTRMGFIDLSEIPSKANRKKWLKMVESTAYGSEMKPYDYNEVLSKLDQAVKTSKAGNDVAVFGVEDDEGAIVKIYVAKDQAEEFEAALGEMLAGESEMSPTGQYEAISGKDIAEIIFELKSKFDIVDADWGDIKGSEEEEAEADVVAGDEEDMEDMDDMEDMEDMEDEPTSDGTEEQAMTALQAVIATLQSDAEAKQAEAKARQMEAEASIAKSSADAAMSKVQQEEEILDMEEAEKAKRDAKKEAVTLAKLARRKKEMQDNGDVAATDPSDMVSDDDVADFSDDGEEVEKEEEEQTTEPEEMNKDELVKLIYQSLMANE